MMTREDLIAYGLSFEDTFRDAPFRDQNWQLVRFMPGIGNSGGGKSAAKAFLWTYERDGYLNINVKVDPAWRDMWRQTYASVIPGYHLNKEHWNTVIIDGSIPDEDIKRMIAESYDLVSDSPTKRIYEAVKRIPRGYVATYGQVAEMAGDKKMARAVGNALHKNPDPDGIPCYRVVNSKGELAGEFAFGGAGAQARILEADGIEVVDGRVDLKKYGMKQLY
ncbi:MAG: methylated-DNA--[protein]-cysteine S-methyltransferase [Lachnospiraceae bacterium]|nr:methylated-DNA--[protein]-cysteine S-methyltransferase [Lachnospiraceae bacterium]